MRCGLRGWLRGALAIYVLLHTKYIYALCKLGSMSPFEMCTFRRAYVQCASVNANVS